MVRLSALSLAILFSSLLPSQADPTAVLTQHNDNARTGANLHETILTLANVRVATFGKLFTINLDANVNGQALYVPAVQINGQTRNVIYVSTSNNSNNSSSSIMAFDADDPNGTKLWQNSLTPSAEWTTTTPVIDPSTGTLYVLTKANNDSGPTQLHALDMLTGKEKTGSPVTIQISVPGNGDGSKHGVVSFDTTHANCRAGLLLLNGIVYVAFSHNSDSFPYHGWVFGYEYNQTKFTQTAVLCTTPDGGLGGIWMAGNGLMADSQNNIYCATGNGTFDVPAGGIDYGMCVLKLRTPDLAILDWFAPFDEEGQSNADLDLGCSGPIGIPGTDRIFLGTVKFGSTFLCDSSNLGHFTANGPDQIIQRFDNLSPNGVIGQNPVCWDATTVKYVYAWAANAQLLQFQYNITSGQFNPAGVFKSVNQTAGGSLAVTAHGNDNGILWAVDDSSVFHAFDARDISRGELWNSTMNATRDGLPSAGHFQFPTITNGKAYVPTGSHSLVVYGLLPRTLGTIPGTPTPIGSAPAPPLHSPPLPK
jgi:hypothetical protein